MIVFYVPMVVIYEEFNSISSWLFYSDKIAWCIVTRFVEKKEMTIFSN